MEKDKLILSRCCMAEIRIVGVFTPSLTLRCCGCEEEVEEGEYWENTLEEDKDV